MKIIELINKTIKISHHINTGPEIHTKTIISLIDFPQ